MKYFAKAITLAAALAIAAPAWAQGPRPASGDNIPPPAAGAPVSTYDPTKAGPRPSSSDYIPASPVRKARKSASSKKRMPLTGTTAQQLNQQELARLQTGAPPPPPGLPAADYYSPQGARPSSAH